MLRTLVQSQQTFMLATITSMTMQWNVSSSQQRSTKSRQKDRLIKNTLDGTNQYQTAIMRFFKAKMKRAVVKLWNRNLEALHKEEAIVDLLEIPRPTSAGRCNSNTGTCHVCNAFTNHILRQRGPTQQMATISSQNLYISLRRYFRIESSYTIAPEQGLLFKMESFD